jgi:hypothetical protein
MGSYADLCDVSRDRSRSVREGRGDKLHELTTRRRDIWLRLVRGWGCNEKSSREPDVFNRIEEWSGFGVVELDGVSRKQAKGA